MVMKNWEPLVPVMSRRGKSDDLLSCYTADELLVRPQSRSLRTWTSIGHGQEERSVMLQLEVFILEFSTIDGFAASAIASREIATLNHELFDDAVEERALVVQRFARFTNALLACAEGTEVLSRLGYNVIVEFECNAASRFSADGDVEEDAATGALGLV